ncbi:MAG TPA: hypothetical protein VM260_25090, partial [Pirellula sp.]|nr:hypothetical protein [Pirellula sp.]
RADTLVIPNIYASVPGPGGGLSLPFTSNSRWQQIYTASEFSAVPPGILEIKELRFRIDEEYPIGTSFSTIARGTSIFISTTTKTFETATAVYSQNIGDNLFEALPRSDLQLIGSKQTSTSFDIAIPLPNHFLYDRTGGNLVIDIQVAGGANLPLIDQQANLLGAAFSVGGALDAPSGTKTRQAMITEIGFTSVPEPTTAVLLVFASIIFWTFQKRKEA